MRKTKYRAGFTLIEVIVALALFSIAAVGIYQSFVISTRAARQAYERDMADTLVASLCEGFALCPEPCSLPEAADCGVEDCFFHYIRGLPGFVNMRSEVEPGVYTLTYSLMWTPGGEAYTLVARISGGALGVSNVLEAALYGEDGDIIALRTLTVMLRAPDRHGASREH